MTRERLIPPAQGLPGYIVRRHPRARRVRLRVTARHGLVVTLPPNAPLAAARDAVAAKAAWAEQALRSVSAERELLELGADALLPHEVSFGMTGEVWRVEYEQAPSPGRATVHEDPGRLRVRGDVDDGDACLAALRRWLVRSARVRLEREARSLAASEGLPMGRLSIRSQRSRWGSCNARGDISLNAGLVFLSAARARSVVLHELVHTLHCDHSAAFWNELMRRDPSARRSRAVIRGGTGEVPLWARR